MGGFINSQSDAEICEVLNKRFSDEVNVNDPQKRTYLNELRDFVQHTEDLFDGNHHLHRIYHRLAVSVTGGQAVPKTPLSRLRWLFLLHGNLPAAVDSAIRGQLTAILSPASAANPAGNVNYVTFSTAHVPTTTGDQFELFDNNNRNSATPTPLSDGNNKSYCALILLCNVDRQLPVNPREPDPPHADNNETNIPFFGPKPPKKPPAKKPAAKKSAKKKKSVKKKKVAKKAAKKTAKKAGKGK